MYSSQNTLQTVWQSPLTVFTANQLAIMLQQQNDANFRSRMNYYVRKGYLTNPRRGIYAKPGYRIEELACLLYTPCYLSLEYVLQRAGVVFQYDSALTMMSYLNREIEVEGHTVRYRQLNGKILCQTDGITNNGNLNIASAERAFLDVMYLNTHYYFDNLHALNRREVMRLLPMYENNALTERVKNLLK